MRDAAALALAAATASSVVRGGSGAETSLLFALPSSVARSSFGTSSQASPARRVAASAADVADRGAASMAGVAMAGTALAAVSLTRRSRKARATARRAQGDQLEMEGGMMTEGVDYMTIIPEGGVKQEDKIKVPRFIYEGGEQVKLDGSEKVPAGQSSDPDKMYFWKMAKDKQTIDVIFPIDDWVESDHIIYRLGEDPQDAKRGPPIELGYRYKTENGRFKENLVIDGQILNAIDKDQCYWTIDEMAGVKVCILTLTRPSMMRQRHDPILKRSTQELRIEPQTWDALLVEERLENAPDITKTVYFDLDLGGDSSGRLEMGLYGDFVPKTVKNFVGLVTGEYTNDEGEVCKSAHCLKGTKFQTVMRDLLVGAGNPGLDHVLIEFTNDELKDYLALFEDFSKPPVDVGQVKKEWAIRWGADLGCPFDEDGVAKKEGSAVDGNSENELNICVEVMRELVAKGNGAKFIFFRPEFDKGCDVTGGTFPAENLTLPHSKRGTLSMDRKENDDVQGSVFFITMKEMPEMDARWCVFGEVTEGWDTLNEIEDNFDGRADKIVITDCGVLAAE